MKKKLLAMMLLAGSSMFAPAMFAGTRFSIGLGFGAPPAYAANIPPCPGPGYAWVAGYWSNNFGRQVWVPGFWNAPPVFTGRIASRFDNHFVARDDHRFDNRFVAHDDHRFENRSVDRDNRQNFARAPQQSDANDNRSSGRDNRQGR